MSKSPEKRKPHRLILVSSVLVVFLLGVVVLMVWLVGGFKPKVGHGQPATVAGRPVGTASVAQIVESVVPVREMAVGSVRPVHRVDISSRLLAKANEVNVVAGQRVNKGDVLVRLEDADLIARRAQAESAVAQAQSALDQARTEESRLRGAFAMNAVTGIEMDRAVNGLKGAEAALERTKQLLLEAQTSVEYATVRSPIAGVVVDKLIQTGDTVMPGQSIVDVLDPDHMQVEAKVRESLSRFLAVGAQVSVHIDGLNRTCVGTVREIVPEAESSSRSFIVKVAIPSMDGLYSGMFGRISIPASEERLILIPQAAVLTLGQVDCVDVVIDGVRHRRSIRLGKKVDNQVVVLSGLAVGEQLVLDSSMGGR